MTPGPGVGADVGPVGCGPGAAVGVGLQLGFLQQGLAASVSMTHCGGIFGYLGHLNTTHELYSTGK